MDFLQHIQHFTKGEVLQGKWMIGIAIIMLLPICILLIKSNYALQKGMAIPFCVLFAITIAYGSYVLYSKPKYLLQTEIELRSSPKQTLDAELQKVKADNKSYHTLKYVWGIGIIAFVVFYFLLTKDFHKGVSLGFAALFFGFLIIDSFFHQRLDAYIEELNRIAN